MVVSISPSPTVPGPRTLSRLPCPACTPPRTPVLIPKPSCPPLVRSPHSHSVRGTPRAETAARPRPPNLLFVPDAVRSRVLVRVHSSKLTCHPGIARTLDFIRCRFVGLPWTQTSVRLLSIIVGARNKTSTRPRSGLPRPLPIPSRGHTSPWTSSPVCPRPRATPPSSP